LAGAGALTVSGPEEIGLRLFMFFRLMIAALCVSLLAFALAPGVTVIDALKILSLGTVASIGIAAYYPEFRGIKAGDSVSVVGSSGIPSLIGKPGTASADGRRNDRIKIALENGNEVLGVIEDYVGLVSPPKVRIIYEEKLVE
jgi:hypothetical protein